MRETALSLRAASFATLTLALLLACAGSLEPRRSSAASSPAAPAPKPEARRPILLVAGGDVSFGRDCGQAILQDPGYDPFRFIAPTWAKADLRFVNLESQLSEQNGETQSPRHHLIFSGPPAGAGVLSRAHIGLVSTANNHAWDYGRSALFETLDNLERAGIKAIGTGRTLEQAQSPVMVELHAQKLAIFAVTHIWNYGPIEEHDARDYVAWANFADLREKIARARSEADFVIVSYHGGEEYIDAPLDRTRAFVAELMAAGVDVVIGHHPHVPQGIGWYGDRPVFYSLGNLVFDGQQERIWTRYGMLARLALQPDHSVQVSACPYLIDGYTPKPLALASERERFRRSLRLWSTSVGGTRVGAADEDGCYVVSPPKPRSPRPRGPLPADRGSDSLARR